MSATKKTDQSTTNRERQNIDDVPNVKEVEMRNGEKSGERVVGWNVVERKRKSRVDFTSNDH